MVLLIKKTTISFRCSLSSGSPFSDAPAVPRNVLIYVKYGLLMLLSEPCENTTALILAAGICGCDLQLKDPLKADLNALISSQFESV